MAIAASSAWVSARSGPNSHQPINLDLRIIDLTNKQVEPRRAQASLDMVGLQLDHGVEAFEGRADIAAFFLDFAEFEMRCDVIFIQLQSVAKFDDRLLDRTFGHQLEAPFVMLGDAFFDAVASSEGQQSEQSEPAAARHAENGLESSKQQSHRERTLIVSTKWRTHLGNAPAPHAALKRGVSSLPSLEKGKTKKKGADCRSLFLSVV